jgi:hypothetical protein
VVEKTVSLRTLGARTCWQLREGRRPTKYPLGRMNSLFALFILVCIGHGEAFLVEWIGQNGLWHTPDMWSTGTVPTVADAVRVNSTANVIITISADVSVSSLALLGGTIEIFGNATLSLLNEFAYEGGVVKGPNQVGQYGNLNISTQILFSTPKRKHFRSLRIVQLDGALTWTEGDLVFWDSTMHVAPSACMNVQASSNNKLSILSDFSRSEFDFYPSSTLNTHVNLAYTVPTAEAIFDIIVDNAVHVTTATGTEGVEIFDLAVEQDPSAAAMYAKHVQEFSLGYQYTLYNRTIERVDEDQCGRLCHTTYAVWCRSFDYFFYNQTCSLSAFKFSQVGGLTSRTLTVDSYAYPISHYQRRANQRGMDSSITIAGLLNITGNNTTWGAPLDLRVDIGLQVSGVLSLSGAVKGTFSRIVTLDETAAVTVSPDATLSIVGEHAGLRATHGSLVAFASADVGVQQLQLLGGTHFFNAEVTGAPSIAIASATLHLYPTNANTTGDDTASSGASTLTLTSLVLADAAAVVMSGHDANILRTETLYVTGGSKFMSNNITFTVSEDLVIDANSTISATGLGYAIADGPGAGSHHQLGGSGGAHAGRGGPSKVDAAGLPYGSLQAPSTAGSGGGRGFYAGSAGGSGGGVLHVICLSGAVTIDGHLEADGEAGAAAGGGGAGGSIYIVADTLYGSGVISASGGDGDFSGGVVAGGGGSGGRIAVHAAGFDFTGTFDVTGGFLQPTHDKPGQEQASPGLAYFAVNAADYAVVTSTQPFADFADNIANRTAIANSEVATLSGYAYRAAPLSAALASGTECKTQLHIIGEASLALGSSEFCLSTVVATSSHASLVLEDDVQVTFAGPTLELEAITVLLRNVSLATNTNITLAEDATILLHSSASAQNVFGSIVVGNDASVVSVNASATLTAQTLSLQEGGELVIAGDDLTVRSAAVDIAGTLRSSGGAASSAVLIFAPSTSVTLLTDVQLENVGVVFEGAVIVVDGAVSLSPTLDELGSSVSLNGSSLLTVTNATLTFRVPVYVNSALALHSGASLIANGGQCSDGGRVNVSHSASISFEGGDFTLQSLCAVAGGGAVRIQNGGVLKPPLSVNGSTPAVRVLSGGRIEFLDALGGVAETNSTYDTAVYVESGGVMLVGNNTRLSIAELGLDGGEIRLASVSAVINLYGGSNVFQAGVVEGNGSLIIAAGAELTLSPGASETLTMLEVAVSNYGGIVAEDNEVNWARSARLDNYGMVSFAGSQVWMHEELLYDYLNLEHCTTTLQSSDNVVVLGRTAVECASLCSHHFLSHARQMAFEITETSWLSCKSFLYNNVIQTCQLQTADVEYYMTCAAVNASASSYDWQLYVKAPRWVGAPVLYNAAGGVLNAISASASDVQIAVVSDGLIEVDAASTLSISSSLNQTAAGTALTNGVISIHEVGYSPLSGTFTGTGTVLLSSADNSNALLDSALINSTTLDVEFRGSIRLENMPYVQAKNVTLVNGRVLITGSAMQLHVGTLELLGNSSLVTSRDLIDEPTEVSLPTPVDASFTCMPAFDLCITANTVQLAEGAQLLWSYGYLAAAAVSVSSGAQISSTGRGYSSASAPSSSIYDWAGTYQFLGSSGGSHGGLGGAGYGDVSEFSLAADAMGYGNFHFANSWGAPGGSDAMNRTSSGGGSVFIHTSSIMLDGAIRSDGSSPAFSLAGGGAGGSVHISADSLTGSGVLSASGGDGGIERPEIIARAGGGGGGRISLYVDSSTEFTGTVTAAGGGGYQDGSSGTVFTIDRAATARGGTLLIEGTNSAEPPTTALATVLNTVSPYGVLDVLSVTAAARVLYKVPAQTVLVQNITGDGTGTLVLANGTTLLPSANGVPGNLVISGITVVVADATLYATEVVATAGAELALTPAGSTLDAAAASYVFASADVRSGGSIKFDYHTMVLPLVSAPAVVVLNVTSNLTVHAGGRVHSDGQGHQGSFLYVSDCYDSQALNVFSHGQGCGSFGTTGGGGGGYGGNGGHGLYGAGGFSYGSIAAPSDFGSGGGGAYPNLAGGSGGGVVRIVAYTAVVDGEISCDGVRGVGSGTAGGSGGSIWLTAEQLMGSGSVHADGGAGIYSDTYLGGAGAGGRVAIHCRQCETAVGATGGPQFSFPGSVTARGGGFVSSTDPAASDQLPIWGDYGFTATDILDRGLMRAAAGTVFWSTDYDTVSTLVVKNKYASTVTLDYIRAVSDVATPTTRVYSLPDAPTVYHDSIMTSITTVVVAAHSKLSLREGYSLSAEYLVGDNTSTLTVEDGSQLNLVNEMNLTSVHLVLKGSLTGAQRLTLAGTSQLVVYPNATWSADGAQTAAYDVTSLAYHQIGSDTSLLNASQVVLDDSAGIVFAGGTRFGDQRAVLLCDKLQLRSAASYITADAMGHESVRAFTINSTTDAVHPSHQASGNISYGDGGWHAGRGGGAYYAYPASGNAFFPVAYGAAGGSTAQARGATGGGSVRVIAHSQLLVDGTISANGQSCSQANLNGDALRAAGGGAGGSVWLEVLSGDLTGSGSISAHGGDGCANGGGAGSGGRVAVFASSADFSQFAGTVDVAAGSQSSTVQLVPGVYPTLPSGGTIFVAGSDGSGGSLTASNNGEAGSDVFAYDSCAYGIGRNSYELDSIVIGDASLAIGSSCTMGVSAGVYSAANAPSFSVASSGGVHNGALELAENATLVVMAPLVLDDVRVNVASASLLMEQSLTLKNATLSLAMQGAQVASFPTGISSTSAALSYVASLSAPSSFASHSMSYINVASMDVFRNSTLRFEPTTSSSLHSVSNVISAHNLTLAASSHIVAAAVLTNPEIEWDTTATLASQYSHYGQHSGVGFAASGGGHAGSGTAGAGHALDGGAPRGDPLVPSGGGGPDGNDLSALVVGGAGGGGLYVNVTTDLVIDGIVDVSGGCASLSSCAGGGAGGSIYIEATTATVSGSGELRAQGGNGSVSSTSAFHGGAGSGGRVAIQACADLFTGTVLSQGGVSVELPLGLPHLVSTKQYQKYSKATDLTHIGSTGFRSMQHIVAASAGTTLRAGVYANASQLADAFDPRTHCTSEYSAVDSYPLSSLSVQGWSVADLQGDTSAVTAAIVASMHLSSPAAIVSVNNKQTPITLPLNNDISTFHVQDVNIADANVEISGVGNLTGLNFEGSHDAALTVAGSVSLTPSAALRISNFTLNLTEQAQVFPGADVYVLNAGKLLLNYGNLTDDFVEHPYELYDPSELMPNLTVKNLVVRNSAGVYGSRIIISAVSVSVLENSTFSADGLGMYGGACAAVPTAGSGLGGGASGDIGADGGGHGGYGAPSLGSLYRAINADQYVGSTADPAMLLSLNTSFLNGTTYGDLFAPVQYGGGGGATFCPNGDGGRGGGVIKLHLQEDLTIDETSSVSADGQGTCGGGGGGAGGSIWILDTNKDSVDIHGHVAGGGRLSARGGQICATVACLTDIDHPGGPGGGGRIRIDKTLERYSGALDVLSGTANQTLDILLTKRMGTFVRVQAISTLVLAQESGGAEALDIIFTQTPLYMVQVITTTGTGTGNRTATEQLDAVVKGFWTLRYRSKGAEGVKLSSQATAQEVRDALQTLAFPELTNIGVTRRPSAGNGWSWSVTFYNEVDRVVPIQVDSGRLWSTNFDSAATVAVLNPHSDALDGSGDVQTSDAPMNVTSTQLRDMMTFNLPVLADDSYGYWRNYRTLRVVPRYSTDNSYFRGLLYQLRLLSLKPVPTMLGKITSTSYPFLLDYFQPNWKFPSSQPTGAPSGQPSSQPSTQPSSSPTNQPSTQPSGQPSVQPSSLPTCQPTVQPSVQPSAQPVSFPTGQPSSQPSMQPSLQPFAAPTSLPSSQPSSRPSMQPTAQPSMQPSAQPVSAPTGQPTRQPTGQPTLQPFSRPTGQPSRQPTGQPTLQPFSRPTGQPSRQPTAQPSRQPSRQPTGQPTQQPFSRPTGQPSGQPSSRPTRQPTSQPSSIPTKQPTSRPTKQPTSQPSRQPTIQPTARPSGQPSCQPSSQPTQPTGQPSSQPTNPTGQPTSKPSIPTSQPSQQPSEQPTCQPSSQPTNPTAQPTEQPSAQPSFHPTSQPTSQPSTPTSQPSSQPTNPTAQPSRQPSGQPSSSPTSQPSSRPSTQPSGQPSGEPTSTPSSQPSAKPTGQPTRQPSVTPSSQSSAEPSRQPTAQPSSRPSSQPSSAPTSQPSEQPSSQPSGQPVAHPTTQPSAEPSQQPSQQPSDQPSAQPTSRPTTQPTGLPSAAPASVPTSQPTVTPSTQPSTAPTSQPTEQPTSQPIMAPTSQPSGAPSAQPSALPTAQPSASPSGQPSAQPVQPPTSAPSVQPSCEPSSQPSAQPTSSPSSQPSAGPTCQPTTEPSAQPSSSPSSQPSEAPSAQPTTQPSSRPSEQPTATPSAQPTSQPSSRPSKQPAATPSARPTTQPSSRPSEHPAVAPSTQPSTQPSSRPSQQPAADPSAQPTSQPSSRPSEQPAAAPSVRPSTQPSSRPSDQPAAAPSGQPTAQPFADPTVQPTSSPSAQPSSSPSAQPTGSPTAQPTVSPSSQPTASPSGQPSTQPAAAPTGQPTSEPSRQPTGTPTSQPSGSPTTQPSEMPTTQPSGCPSSQPTADPTTQPSHRPSNQPTADPTTQPSRRPSSQPTADPTTQPSRRPSSQPTADPTSQPSIEPSALPTAQPSSEPSSQPSAAPSAQPSARPSQQPTGKPVNP